MSMYSRHPKINYWFFFDSTFKEQNYIRTIDRIAKDGQFDLLALTDRGCDFWDPTHKEDFRALVDHAHQKGIRIVLQLWPHGFFSTAEVSLDEAAAITIDVEETVRDGKVTLRSVDKWTRGTEKAPPIHSEFLFAYAFQKTADGYYIEDSLVDVSERLCTAYASPNRISATLALPEYEGYTVFAVAAHYHRFADVFSERMINDYRDIMDFYADVPFDGIVLDEFKGVATAADFTISEPFRARMYGHAFARVFQAHTGVSLVRTLFDMRYCPVGKDEVRAAAINRYFDEWRRGTSLTENFVGDYAKTLYGEGAFLGLHSTYHNNLTNDEIWNTACNWWELKRDYAQTDEDMVMPVRMGLACRAKEAIVYDMYYHKDKLTFFSKAVREAAFGSRIHYHAIDDGSQWGLDTGSEAFLSEVAKYEDAVELLNRFEPTLPAMSLLCVFGFPALLNWYPDESVRAQFDVNKSLGILEKSEALWRDGYHNALAPDDCIVRGEITLGADGRFDYCGHKFDSLLFLYPEYSKPETLAFLQKAAAAGARVKVIGALTRGFDGETADGSLLAPITQGEVVDAPAGEAAKLLGKGKLPGGFCASVVTDAAVAQLRAAAEGLGARKNDIENGCRLFDGSVVISHYESLRDGEPITACFTLDGARVEATFIGTFAIKASGGAVEKLVCHKLLSLKRDGKDWLPDARGERVTVGV